MKKKLFIPVGVVVVVVVVVIAVGLANVNRIIESQRDPILARAEQALGRDISVGEINATLWPDLGVRISSVTMADDPAFSSEPFVSADGVHVSVRLMPLLRKQVEVKRLTLERPRITVVRNEDGVLNYAGLMAADASASGDAAASPGSTGDAAAIPLLLAFADINDGEVRYVDSATGLDHTVRHIDFTARDVSLESEVHFEMRAALFGEEVDLELSGVAGPVGEMPVDPAGVPLSVTARFGPLETARLLALAVAAGTPVEFPEGATVAGSFSGEATVGGSVGSLQLDCSVDLTGLTVVMGELFQKGDGTSAGIDIKGTIEPGNVDLPTIECRLGEVTVWADAHLGEQPRFGIRADAIDVARLAPFIPMVGTYAARGTLSLNAHIAPGVPDHPVADGTVTLRDGAVRLPQLPSEIRDASARVTFETESFVVEDATFTVGQSVLTVGLSAERLEPLDARFSVRAPIVHRADFQAPVPGAAAPPRPEVLRDVVVEGRITGSGDAVRLEARLGSASGVLSNVDYSVLFARVEGDRDLVTVESYRASVFGGTISGKGSFRPTATPPSFELTTLVKNVNLAEYFRYKYEKLPKVIEGRVSLKVDIGGRGGSWEAIQPTLSGKGDAIVLEGALLNMNIAKEFVDGVQSIPLVPSGFSQRMRSKHPELFEGERTIFDNLRGTLTIDRGRVHTKDVFIAARGFDVAGAGWVGFDRQMNFKTSVIISKAMTDEIVQEIPAAKYLLSRDGRIVIPLKISGLTTRPALALDTDAVVDRIQEKMLQDGSNELKNKIRDLFGGKKD